MKIARTILPKLIEEIGKPCISILIGPRQVGKSFMLRELSNVCEKRKLTTTYYNLEDPDAGRGKILRQKSGCSGWNEEVFTPLQNAPGGIVYSINESGYTMFEDRRIDFFKLDRSEEIEYLKPQ